MGDMLAICSNSNGTDTYMNRVFLSSFSQGGADNKHYSKGSAKFLSKATKVDKETKNEYKIASIFTMTKNAIKKSDRPVILHNIEKKSYF